MSWITRREAKFRPRQTAFALLLASIPATAAAPRPRPPAPRRWVATLDKKPAVGIRFGQLPIELEKTTLDELNLAASIGRISHHAGAAESNSWLCYTLPGPHRSERLWFISDDVMGGKRHLITSISAQVLKTTKPTPSCPELPKGLQPVGIGPNLWLDSSADDVQKELGKPSYSAAPWYAYNYEGIYERDGCGNAGLDVMNWLDLKIDGGRVMSLQAGQTSGCKTTASK